MFRLIVLTVMIALASSAAGQEDGPVRPDKVMKLFAGDGLKGFETWLKDSGRNDPKKVFAIKDGVLHISGEGFGYLATARPYRDYRLVGEFKWGTRTDGGKYVRNSGILLHAQGEHGSAGGVWMPSIECQLAQGCVGDLIPIPSKSQRVEFKSDVAFGPDRRPRWKKGGESKTFANKQLWWNDHDPDFKELLDTRGKNDVESPLGEWTKIAIECRGKQIAVSVNGKQVNVAYDASPGDGRILFQCEGFEILFRNFEMQPLKE
ncbi:MAG: DUF1080 domain-containing protein [Gemmataceae bacterium]|nr:DUF1080 domain-containing protein [Gemmataceae bacterium]